jgi:hypothetical protein
MALWHGGASPAQIATVGHPSTCRAMHGPAPSFVRAVLAHGPAGLVSRGCAERHRCRSRRSHHHRAAWRVHRVAVVLADIAFWRGLISAPGHSVGSRRTASGLACHRFGLPQRDTARRRLAGHSNVPALARVLADDRSFEGPSNKRMEPSRLTVLCDHVATARGSFAALCVKQGE